MCFLKFFYKLVFLCRICVGYIGNLPIYWRYIDDIERFFSIFPRNDFLLQKSCRDDPTPEISTIYRRYFTTFLTLGKTNLLNIEPYFLTSKIKPSDICNLLEESFYDD